MPKVNEEYFEMKKNKILDSAFSVCMKKPVGDVTMADIIAETGLSQGGVYKYFSNIDEVFIALTNRLNDRFSFREELDDIFKEPVPEVLLKKVFDFITENILLNLTEYGKISFELDAMYANYPEREQYYLSSTKFSSEFDYLTKCLFGYIAQKVKENYFRPVLPLQNIFMFIIVSYDGIRRDIILSKCYHSQDIVSNKWQFNERELMGVLYKSIMFLLNPNNQRSG